VLDTPHILLPGPTPVPERVQQAMLRSMSDHRGNVFEPVLARVYARLAALLHVGNAGRIAVLPASGTGGLEAAIQNFFQPGDRVLSVETGLFGKRFKEIAQAMDIQVETVAFEWGQAFDAGQVLEVLERTPVKGVLLTHNETSTGVLNPVETLAPRIRALPHSPLILVDSISGVPSVPFNLMQSQADVIIAASQKGFMCPPGLAILGLSGRAVEHVLKDRRGRHYLDLRPYLDGHLPYTPAVSLIYGLDAALELLDEEGEAARLARHRQLAQMARAFGEAAGLPPLVSEKVTSPTVTALSVPAPLTPAELRRQAAERGLQIAGGLGPWHHSAIRIGHVGAVDAADLWGGLGILAHMVPNPIPALEAAFTAWKSPSPVFS